MSANDNMGQEEIDKLLNGALSDIAPEDAGADSAQSQDDIDALLAAAGQNAETANDDNSTTSQADIDALLAAAGQDNAGGEAASQDDIDALLAAAGQGAGAEENSSASQDDIDALLANAREDNAGGGEAASQDDIDALLAAAGQSADAPQESAPAGQDDIDSLLASANTDSASETAGQSDIDSLLAAADSANANEPAGQDDIDAMLAAANDMNSEGVPEPEETGENPQAPEAAAVAETAAAVAGDDAAETAENADNSSPADDLLSSAAEENSARAAAIAAAAQVSAPASAPVPETPLPAAPKVPDLTPEQLATLQDSLSLSGSSGEVENLAGQISGLLGQLSEKSRRFQMAWLAAEQQARELRYQQTLSEHRIHVLTAEKESSKQETELLRKQQSQNEGEKIALTEAHRTEIASLQLRIREQESRNQMLVSEGNALKEELERARNDATGADLESRRARFDAERLNNELASERQERQRLARALENREKELQATQAQAAGHASTLFLDELHRLVRRLESELDIRSTAANEALSVFDRMEFSPEMQMHAVTLRAALCTAAGLTADENDALKKLDVQGERPNAIPPLNPSPAPGEDSFVKALTRYDFTRASGICSALMRSGNQTPYDCMKDIHNLEALRHPEIAEHLDDLAALLRGIKSLQEASDRSRGRENEHTEKAFVMMFDLLHSLVRLKLVSRSTPAIWELFLELRGRFSFLTSDRQWKEYRERVLKS